MKLISKICLLLSLVFSPILWAKPSAEISLWQVEIPVENQTAKVRHAATIQAFDRLMMRLTGDDRETVISNFSRIRRQASQWVTQFSYHPEIDITKDPPQERQILNLVFDEMAIQQMIIDKGLRPWLGRRPGTVIIFAFSGLEELGMVGDTHFVEEQRRQWIQKLKDMATAMALPIRFVSEKALLESISDEEQPFGLSDVLMEEKRIFMWDANKAPAWIGPWMKTFDTSSLLLGQLIIDRQGQWQARWEHYVPHAARVLAVDGNADTIISSLEDFLGKNIRTEFFENREIFDAQKVRLELHGITSLSGIEEVREILENMEYIDSFRLDILDGDTAVFELITHRGLNSLKTALDKVARFEKPVFPAEDAGVKTPNRFSAHMLDVLHYQWQ